MKAIPRSNNRLHLIGAVGTDHPPEAAGGGRRLWALGNLVESLREPSSGAETKPTLTAYPNPGNGPVYLVYQVPDGVDKVSIRVTDTTGRTLLDRTVADNHGIMELDTQNWANGLHIATIDYDGFRVGSVKLDILGK